MRRRETQCRLLLIASRLAVVLLLLACMGVAHADDGKWVRPLKVGDPLTWGRRDGAVFGLISPGGLRGPRGLIRIGFYPPGQASPQLLNFIAIEPVVKGPGGRFDRMAFSELEMSGLDPGQRGKRMWVHAADRASEAGTLETVHTGNAAVERLSVRIDVERFNLNGAHVYVVLSVDADRPAEVRVQGFAEGDSAPVEELSVTATMGNFERLRQLWLKDRVLDSRTLFGNYSGDAFVEGSSYPLDDLMRTDDGDAIVFCSSNETSPEQTEGNTNAHWPYLLPKRTQYWRVPGYDVQPDLRVRVNARRVYWASHAEVLGGIAFENFELRQRFIPGQAFIFGMTPEEPASFFHELQQHETPATAHPDTHIKVQP